MQKILLFLTFLCCVQGTALAQDANAGKVSPAYYLSGKYYSGDFAEKARDYFGGGISSIKDNEGNRVMLLLQDVKDLDPRYRAMEIPREKVKNLEELDAQVNRMIGMIHATHVNLSKGNELKVGRVLPGSFSLQDLQGKSWTPSDLIGKVTVINVWYSGCGPCIAEMPQLSEWKNAYPDVLFLSADFETPDVVKKVVDRVGFNWNHMVKDTYFTKWVGLEGYPLTIVLDKHGVVKYMTHGTNEAKRAEILKTFQALR